MAVPVATGTLLPTSPTVLKAPVPRLTTWAGVLTRAPGTPLTNLIVLAGAFLSSGHSLITLNGQIVAEFVTRCAALSLSLMNVLPDVVHGEVGHGVDGLGHGVDGVHGEVGDSGDGIGDHVDAGHGGVWENGLNRTVSTNQRPVSWSHA